MDLEYRASRWPPTTGWRRLALQELEGDWKLKAKFLAMSYLQAGAFAPILGAKPGSSLHRYLEDRPETPGFVL